MLGINNKQRRAAKRRKSGRGRGAPGGARPGQASQRSGSSWDPLGDAFAIADPAVWKAVRSLTGRKSDDASARRHAESLERRLAGDRHVLEAAVLVAVANLVERVVEGGWGPVDLEQLVRRCAHRKHVPTLAAALHHDRRNHDRGVDWQAACDRVGADDRLRLGSTAALASALRVSALLLGAPVLDAASAPPVMAEATHPKLAKVRALLAKAESTPFDKEAEALSAKAQELIARYSLGRLLHQGSASHDDNQPQVHRLWLDSPYVGAKAALVHGVAVANRCRAAASKPFGFSVVVGAPHDLEAVELLVTSLLVQADAAMLRGSRHHGGPARTRSFRQSFLVAYAARIGVRLREAASAEASAVQDGRLLPVLRDHHARVSEAFDAMVPHERATGPAITNAAGWAAGTAAADLARLGVSPRLKMSDETA